MGPDERPPAVDVEVAVGDGPGPGLDEFVLTAQVGDEPPEAVELTDVQRYLANGGG